VVVGGGEFASVKTACDEFRQLMTGELGGDRREFLRTGAGLAAAGMFAPWLAKAEPRRNGAKSCILVYLLGGPPHQDMWDLKPEAPKEIRGPFSPIRTNVSGIRICEHMPRLARIADKYALVRSVSRRNSNHTPMIYYTLTGRDVAQPQRDNDRRAPLRDDFPHLGAVLARFKPVPAALPGYIALPEVAIRSSTKGQYKRARTPLRGGSAGFLGAKHDALNVNGEVGTPQAIPALLLPEDISGDRFEKRAMLLNTLDGSGPSTLSTDEQAALRERAVTLTGAASRGGLDIFSLEKEPAKVRARYGDHPFGRTMLLARRLAEAGVPMVAVHFNNMTVCDGWDTHSKNFEALQTELLPYLDQGLSALIEDLDQRGRLDETLVSCFGEFGRTPKINGNAGRDHWGECGSALFAGGGIRPGQVIGASDAHAAYPTEHPVDPADLHATIYHCMGLDLAEPMHDRLQRPHPITTGRVIKALL